MKTNMVTLGKRQYKESTGGKINSSWMGACTVNGKGCFLADTKVMSIEGLKRIEEVKTGELILARIAQSDRLDFRTVQFRTIGEKYEYLEIHAGEGAVKSTLNHRFCTDLGWVCAKDLVIGTKIFTASGGWIEVSNIVRQDELVETYNLVLEEGATYCVGVSGLVVESMQLSDNEKKQLTPVEEVRM